MLHPVGGKLFQVSLMNAKLLLRSLLLFALFSGACGLIRSAVGRIRLRLIS